MKAATNKATTRDFQSAIGVATMTAQRGAVLIFTRLMGTIGTRVATMTASTTVTTPVFAMLGAGRMRSTRFAD